MRNCRLLLVICTFSSAEKKRDAPQTAESYEGVDDSCKYGILSTAKPSYRIELKKSNASPVKCTDDYK